MASETRNPLTLDELHERARQKRVAAGRPYYTRLERKAEWAGRWDATKTVLVVLALTAIIFAVLYFNLWPQSAGI